MEKLLYNPEEAAWALGVSRSRFFQLLAAGEIESVKIGRSRRVPVAAVESFVASLADAQRLPEGH